MTKMKQVAEDTVEIIACFSKAFTKRQWFTEAFCCTGTATSFLFPLHLVQKEQIESA